MGKIIAALQLLIVIVIGGCFSSDDSRLTSLKSPQTDAIAALNDINSALIQQFNEYDSEMAYTALRLRREGPESERAAMLMRSLQRIGDHVRMAGTVDLQGRRILSWPDLYLKQAVADVEILEHAGMVMPSVINGETVMSAAFTNKLGELAVNYVRPVKGEDNIVTSAFYIQIAVTELLRQHIFLRIVGMPLNVWVLQTDGLIIYDTAPEEIGINVFRDDYFRDFPSVIEMAKRIAAAESGTGEYTYFTKANQNIRIKSAQWNTVKFGGTHWRIVLNLEERPFR